MVTCDYCETEISGEAPLIVPRMPDGISRFHAGRRDCRVKALLTTQHTWPARRRARKIREAMHGPARPVS